MKPVLDEITQADLFEKIGEICAAVNVAVSTKDLLDVSLRKTMDLFGAKRGSIFLLDEESNNLTLEVAQGLKTEETKQLVSRLGVGVVGKVAELKQPIFVDDIENDQRFSDFKARGSYSTVSFICAPMMLKDKLIGVINITDKETGNKFNHNEMQLLDFLMTQIALNYRRVLLYQKFKRIVKEKHSLESKLGETDIETKNLKKQIVIQEKLATIGKLAGGIAHEFNNPLDGVMRYTNLCLDQVEDQDEIMQSYLVEIKHGLNRMANIVKNLLACSRNEMPKSDRVDFAHTVDHVLSGIIPAVAPKEIKINKKIASDIPRIFDYGIETIMRNLIRNSIDAIDEKGRIDVEAEVDQGFLIIRVADTGCGFPDDDLQKMFEPFYTTKDIDRGCGLGLTVVGEIVKSYNGKINVESQQGKGATFIISIPLDENEEENG